MMLNAVVRGAPAADPVRRVLEGRLMSALPRRAASAPRSKCAASDGTRMGAAVVDSRLSRAMSAADAGSCAATRTIAGSCGGCAGSSGGYRNDPCDGGAAGAISAASGAAMLALRLSTLSDRPSINTPRASDAMVVPGDCMDMPADPTESTERSMPLTNSVRGDDDDACDAVGAESDRAGVAAAAAAAGCGALAALCALVGD